VCLGALFDWLRCVPFVVVALGCYYGGFVVLFGVEAFSGWLFSVIVGGCLRIWSVGMSLVSCGMSVFVV